MRVNNHQQIRADVRPIEPKKGETVEVLAGEAAPGTPSPNPPLPPLSDAAEASKQRKADWAILREMSQYIWPKVGVANCS